MDNMSAIKQAEKVAKYLSELKEIDTKVLSLEKMANTANLINVPMSISLSCGIKPENKISVSVGLYRSMFDVSPISIEGDEWKEKKEDVYCSQTISEQVDIKHFFIFCDFMLKKYNERREFLINKLNQIINL